MNSRGERLQLAIDAAALELQNAEASFEDAKLRYAMSCLGTQKTPNGPDLSLLRQRAEDCRDALSAFELIKPAAEFADLNARAAELRRERDLLDAKIAPLRRRCAELRKEVEFYVPPVPSRFSPAEKPKAVIDHQRAMDELSALNAARDRIDFNIRQAIERAHELQITHNAIVSKIGDIFDVYCEAS